MGVLYPRWCGYGENCRDGYSRWDSWGRWVAFAVIVGIAFIIFFMFACFNARRRRSHGLRPHPGTAWLAGPPPSYSQSQPYHQQQPYQQPYYGDPYSQQPPPPQYSPPNPQTYGYFGGQPQQSGIELQQPPNAYPHDRVYQAPPGPPPAKD
ncbi:hypothetical protein ASPWEDRAFT_32581 [Aspergillus wentii DTO 134E9]|uniref:Chitin synthesis regulation, resistance to congo red-domain-containing protein n=1 Tax=Aspergillus wentii DTO 134E9 TaxID=1073089 RepID=A0A1L9R664_ASPWE|nr:uncharacterized protein ASPWEDRAFT_32581 [Aspergillus wentii DTO 134E9]KAI9926928.1 hypothetical protein MW887_004027 [Aspergillus wentii]OJJ30399.1 hypothetical protein ASPWEDRAFT_32581 [Aspergillus wentii DTO 134E9]